MRTLKLAFGLAVFGALCLSVQSASALTAAPTVIDLSANPGEKIERTVRLKNETEAAETLQPTTQNFVADPLGGGKPMYIGNKNANSLANWIVVSSTKVKLAAGESKDVKFTINVPANAEPGGHYAAIMWGEAAAGQAAGSNLAISGELAAPMILLNVRGAVNESEQLLSFATKTGAVKFDQLPISFVTKIANNGNVHFQPQGTITITNIFGATVATIPFNNVADGGNVLPQSVREFESTWMQDQAMHFGIYTAKLNFAYGKTEKTESSEITFKIMPPGALFGFVLVLLGVLLVLILGMKNMMCANSANTKKGRR